MQDPSTPLPPVVVLLSGGVDSTVLLAQAVRGGRDVRAIFFDYNQVAYCQELEACRALTRFFGASLEEVRLSFMFRLPWQGDVVPFRNGVMLSAAVAFAIGIGAKEVLLGATANDHLDFADCRPSFTTAFGKATEAATGIAIRAPLTKLAKEQVIELGDELRVPWSMTWSCYRDGESPCGECRSCKERDVVMP